MKSKQVNGVLVKLESLALPDAMKDLARFGITTTRAYGISAPVLKQIAKELGKNHHLALQLWETAVYDARVLAFLIDEPEAVTELQMEAWVADFDSWAVCDGCCLYLFGDTPFAWAKAEAWTERNEEYVKRAGFTLMAVLAIHDKQSHDGRFEKFFPLIIKEAVDGRNFVKKAVNWALRQIGKRSLALNKQAIRVAQTLRSNDSASARWIASDALRELQSDAVQARLQKKKERTEA